MSEATGLDGFVTFIYSPQPERAWHFYGELLGLPMVQDEGAARIFRVAGRGYLGVCRESAERPCEPRGVCLSLCTGDVEGWHARLTEAGVTTLGPPEALPQFGITSFFLHDPDGHLVEVQRFDHPPWGH